MKCHIFSWVLFAVLLSTTTGCKRHEKFTVQQNRIVLNVREQLGVQADIKIRKATEYHGRYYCVFHYDCLFPMNYGQMLFAIEKSSHKVMQLPWPNEANSFYDELFVRHDTLFLDLYGSWHEHDFFYDTLTSQWIKCSELDELVYEDADYRVYAMDNGEFGQAMWFENLNSRNEYVLEGLGDVHRLGDTFYVVGRNLVRTLTTHQLSKATPSSKTHHHASDDYSVFVYDTVPPLGGDTVYCDPRYNWWEDFQRIYHDTVIVGSFVSDGKLQLVVSRPDSIALMCIAGTHELQTTRLLGERNIFLRGKTGRGLGQTDGVLLPFRRDHFSMGLLDIKGNKVEVLEIGHDIDTLVAQPTDGLNPLLTYLKDHWNHITDSAIHHFEYSNGGTFLITESIERSGYFRDLGFREGFHIDYFYKLVDTLYIVCTEYCVRENDGSVVAVFMDMMLPKYDYYHTREQQIRSLITARLDDICGPHRQCKDGLLWHLDPLRIILFDMSERLLIY